MAVTTGTAISVYRKKIDPNARKQDFLVEDEAIRRGRVSPMRIKLKMLKSVPKISPFASAFCAARIKINPTIIATVRAREQYFFSVCLRGSIIRIFRTVTLPDDLEYLAVNNHTASDNSEDNKYGNKNTFGSDPSVNGLSCNKTKNDTAGHCQPQLHDNLHIVSPGMITFVIKQIFPLFSRPALLLSFPALSAVQTIKKILFSEKNTDFLLYFGTGK
jgi:hypothetical protein